MTKTDLALKGVFGTMIVTACSRGSMFQPYVPLLFCKDLGAI